MSEEKIVPPRADFKAQPVFVKSTIGDQAGAKPGFVRHWFNATDESHPQFWRKYATSRQVGSPSIGYARMEAWNVVPAEEAKAGGRKRDDQGGPIDTALRHGDLVCLETTVENYAVLQELDRLKDREMAAKLSAGDSEMMRDASGSAIAQINARIGTGGQHDGPETLLR